jgi:uncharacterized membrane protein YbhN (UPF0104 family)
MSFAIRKQDTSRSLVVNEDNIEKEALIFFGYIEHNKASTIKTFLSIDKYEIWNYRSKEDCNETVLHLSIKTKNIAIISSILKYCNGKLSAEKFKQFINQKNDKGVVALHYASFLGNVDIIKYLVNYGADIKALTNNDLNVIHYAAQGNQPNSLVYFYLFHRDKIKIEKTDIKGSTPLHWASYSSSCEIGNYLLNYGANINTQDKSGNTPLHLATIKNSLKMVQRLLQKGAVATIRNKENDTPEDIALKNKSKEIYELLRESEKCQLCNVKAPIHRKAKSIKNIIIAFVFQILTGFVFFCFLFPHLIYYKNALYICLLLSYIILTIIFAFFYIKLIVIDPGRPKKCLTMNNIKQLMKKKEVKIDLFRYCPKCLVLRGKNIKHCIICDQCCEGFDHHCFWVNNCIGKYNYNSFIIFLIVSFLDILLIFLICLFCFFTEEIENLEEKQREYRDKLSISNFLNFPILCMFLNVHFLKIVLNIITFLTAIFFLIPEFILIIIHTRNMFDDKKKQLRSSITSFVSQDLLSEINNSTEQEYTVTDFGDP